MKRILVAVDLADYSELVVARAAEFARSLQAEIVAVHVYDPDVLVQTLAEVESALDQYVDGLQHSLTRLFRGAMRDGIPVRAEVVEGHVVSRAVLDVAQRVGADLIVMGTHGRTGVWRTILGSVAEGVLRHAAVPVLVIPMRTLVPVMQPVATRSVLAM